MYFVSLHGHGTSCSPGASGAPTVCMHGTTRFSSLSISAKTGVPIRAMIRIFTTAYAESVSCTPICDIGEPIGPIEYGSTYIVRPCMLPRNSCFSFFRITYGSSQLLVGPAVSFDNEQINVRFSTRATSFGDDRARKHPGQSFSLSLVNVPAFTSWSHRKSYSACEPSIQWMRSGCVRSAIFSTQRIKCLFVVGGATTAVSTITVFINERKSLLF